MGLALGDGGDLSLAGLAGRAGAAGRAGVVLAAAEGDDVADLQAIISAAGGLAAGAAKRNGPKKIFPVCAFFGLASTAGRSVASQYLRRVWTPCAAL